MNMRFATLTFSEDTAFLFKNNRIVVVINHLQLSIQENSKNLIRKMFQTLKIMVH